MRRAYDWWVLKGIFWVLRSRAPWRDLLDRYGPRTISTSRFVLRRPGGLWDCLMDAITVHPLRLHASIGSIRAQCPSTFRFFTAVDTLSERFVRLR